MKRTMKKNKQRAVEFLSTNQVTLQNTTGKDSEKKKKKVSFETWKHTNNEEEVIASGRSGFVATLLRGVGEILRTHTQTWKRSPARDRCDRS